MYSKINAPYLIAGAFATLALLASGTFAVVPYVECLSSVATFNVALPVALSLFILSVLVLALLCKMISDTKKVEVEKNKFAKKEQELANVKQQLENKIQELESKATLEEVEKLKDQLNRLTQEKNGLGEEVEKLNKKLDVQLEQTNSQVNGLTEELDEKDDKIGKLQDELYNIKYQGKDAKRQADEPEIQQATVQRKEAADKQVEELTGKKQGLESILQDARRHNEKVKELKEEARQLSIKSASTKAQLDNNQKKLNDKDSKIQELKDEIDGYKELSGELQTKVDLITKEKKELSKKLEEKSQKLYEINNLLKEDSNTLEGINRKHSNDVKKLQALILNKSSQVEQYKGYFEDFVQHLNREIKDIEECTQGNSAIEDYDRNIVLNIIQVIQKSIQSLLDNKCILEPTEGGDKENLYPQRLAGYKIEAVSQPLKI